MNKADANNLLNILNATLVTRNWNDLYDNLNPKSFGTINSGELANILAKLAEILVSEEIDIPDRLKIILLKCLGNSCLNAYKHADYEPANTEYGKYCKNLYADLAEDISKFQCRSNRKSYPRDNCFPYGGVAEWTVDYIISHCDVTPLENQSEVLRLCIQFLCNLFSFACDDINSLECKSVRNYSNSTALRNAITKLICIEEISVSRAACMFIHNALRKFGNDYFTENDKSNVGSQLLRKVTDLICAKDALLRLLDRPEVFQSIYEDAPSEDKLNLLQILHEEAQRVIYQSENDDAKFSFSEDLIKFLSKRFCRRSDLILKTKDTYLDNFEPMEVILLLDVLGVLTSKATDELRVLQKDKSLLINCCYLLKSLHMCGKESNNYFTPMQKLSDVAPSTQGRTDANGEQKKPDPQHHPAFGFKAGLIRVIGNMSYKNKECQDIIRETDGIPLLLDCCNIDARNPLIMQWTILAVRNICEGNPENQEVIHNSTKIGTVDTAVIKEMGLTLHEDEDGKSIGIVPLARDNNQ